ncbi:type I-C CRISPR-associated protein Cas8c/Csd1 [Paenibacillus sp. J5C_2022]|uniref:type I-C CRISPR-associated protein Cas8c/Csd1 n=1 Tax=Paenibacillus sp. J5C2022 TaxID=2977129 RepID=UPI0021D177E4|nr:type I-C CRISPR-associated protein Cas8c/Csd1 [Paenibacillus sp. J5C2022]MCU6710674.1 type I-C CRISPR-associated protein Cas8c/Csd1 [Paenibacillus sp. J5C2022]
MILQSLYAYYEKLLEEESDGIPREGYSAVAAAFEVHLDEEGQVSSIIPYVNEKGKPAKRTYIVPEQRKRAGKTIVPYFLCDKAEYLFGESLEMREICRIEMRAEWQKILDRVKENTPEVQALHKFIAWDAEQLTAQLDGILSEDVRASLLGGGFCVLRYAPTGRYMHDDRMLQTAWEGYSQQEQDGAAGEEQMCLMTGEIVPVSQIARLHPNIKNVVGAQSSGAAIVSFNIPSFCSYGKEQSYNAPTSKKAADAYGYVLNRLLADPKHRVRFNDTTVVFWVESGRQEEQDFLTCLLQESSEQGSKHSESPDADSIRERVKGAVEGIRKGQRFQDTFDDLNGDAKFYVLGLSPNAARVAIRFWYTGTLKELGAKVWQHYEDLSIVGLNRSPAIREILRELAVGREWGNIPPNMEGQLFRSVMLGGAYSRAVFVQLINRIRADKDNPQKGIYKIGALRAAMLKAYLKRSARLRGDDQLEGELTMGENIESTSVPYHLGRLFACLEKAQANALGQQLNATVRDRFWGAASASPSTVFPRLLNLAQHHVSKDEKWGKYNDDLIQKVMSALPEKLPRRMTLEEQGMFAIGYYHKRESFYKSQQDQ